MTTAIRQRRVVECMGTVFSFDVRSPQKYESVLDDAVRWLDWVDTTFSTYRSTSDIRRLAAGEVTLEDCAPEVGEILRTCELLSAETAGYFSAYAGGALDPSGLVKGWAIERASDLLVAAGSTYHCVNGGGDVQCVGDPQAGQVWRVGIAHPLHLGKLASVVVGSRLAVATSGTAERGGHVLDPHTGKPAHGLASVTVAGTCLGRTDAFATAACAMGSQARDWLEELPGHYGFGIDNDGTTWATSGWGLP